MPTPEFVILPDFLKFHCINTDSENCSTCPRDFAIQSSMVEAVFKDKDNKALLLIQGIHYCPSPSCGGKYQIIKTTKTYEETLTLLDGKVTNFGDVNMDSNISIQVNG